MIAMRTSSIHVMHVLHSLGTGGAERIVCDLARARAGEIQTSVLCLDGEGTLADDARAAGVQVVCLGRRDGFDASLPGRIREQIAAWRPNVIHAHQYTPYFYSALGATLAGFRPIIFTEHGRHWPDVVSPARRAVNQMLRLRRDRITAVCQFVADALRTNERIVDREVRIIPNGVRTETFDRPGRRDWLCELLAVPRDSLLCLQVARFHPVKDHETSIRALSAARAQGCPAQLILAGDGPEQGKIESLCHDLDVRSAVHFLGPRRDVPDLLAAADLLVLSSRSEAASLSILEAMSAGKPVVATDVGGNGEIVLHNATGLLSPRRDPAAMAAHLTALWRDPAMRARMGAAGRQRAQRHYDQRLMHEAFIDLYRRVAEDRR